MEALRPDQAEPLLKALEDAPPETRLAVLDALTRLPLDPSSWFAVRPYVRWALEARDVPEHLGVIELAARVPIRSLRHQLGLLAREGSPEERALAAAALAEVGDDSAIEPLLALLDPAAPGWDTARLLARFDVSAWIDDVRRHAAAQSRESRFWLALALARTGDDAELQRVLATEGFELPFYSDPSLVIAEFRRGPPLPGSVRERLLAAVPGLGGEARRAAELLLEAADAEEAVERQAPASGQPPAVAEELRVRVRAALDARPVLVAADVEAAVDEVAAESDRGTVLALAVSELFRRRFSGREERPFFGNEIVTMVDEAEGFVPDCAGLLEAYLPRAAEAPPGAQLGWTAARGGLPYLISALAPDLADAGRRLAAAHLIAAAAEYADGWPPIVGGASPPPAPPTPPELIEDMATANGGGRRRGLEASPPEEAPAEAAPPEEAPAEAAPPEEAAAEAAPPEEAPPEGPRRILARVTDVERPGPPLERAFRSGGTHEIAIAIGPAQKGMLAAGGSESFDEALGPVADQEQLFVTFIPPPAVSPPQTGTIFLPAKGTSRPCTFGVKVPTDLTSFEAQIQVYHRNRMVQMALLRGPVVADPTEAESGARIEFELAVIRPGSEDLGGGSRFDAALARTGTATTAVADDTLAVFDDDRIAAVVPGLREILTRLATSEAAREGDLEDAGVVEQLLALAFQGRELHKAIAEPIAKLGEPLDRIQVLVESASDFFPVEVVYDLPTPKLAAGLCPGWKSGLTTGACVESHAPSGPRNLADHVCPTGFWAVSKVIERQVVGKETWSKLGHGDAEFVVRSHPTSQRRSLEPPQVVLFAASDRVDDVKKGEIAAVRETLEGIARQTTYADTWDGWVEAVGNGSPSLLVLLSHTAEKDLQAGLEVGAGDLCLISQVESPYVRSSTDRSPIVLLLGCETAVSDFGLQTFVAKFQDLGAALVVGTVASVLGQRAAPVARTIATDLAAAAGGTEPISAGELLLQIRRKLLAQGEMTALCLTAFGDADWQLGGG